MKVIITRNSFPVEVVTIEGADESYLEAEFYCVKEGDFTYRFRKDDIWMITEDRRKEGNE